MYYISKIIKKLYPACIKNSKIDKTSKVEGGSQVINSVMKKYSFCGYNCTILNTSIGAFCSLASNVKIGLASHPLEWVSTSPAFYYGRDSIKKTLANKSYTSSSMNTIIGNDVWVGENVVIKGGIVIGDGAVIGMGSIVTKDIPAYEIWAGNPARFIRKRFDEKIIEKLIELRWWDLSNDKLQKITKYIDDPHKFINAIEKLK